MKKLFNMFLMLPALLMAGGCTDVEEEFGCEAEMSLKLVTITPVDKYKYSAEYELTVSNTHVVAGKFVEMGCVLNGTDPQYSGETQKALVPDVNDVADGVYHVVFSELYYGQSYDICPFIRTERASLVKSVDETLSYPSLYAALTKASSKITTYNSAQISIKLSQMELITPLNYGFLTIEVTSEENENFSMSHPTYIKKTDNQMKDEYVFTFENLRASTNYQYRITIDGNKLDTKKFTTGAYEQVNAIDLGLSVKWADRNLGSTTVSEKGGLYSWQMFDAGVQSSISGTVYDRASWLWGGGYRMPSLREFDELWNYCSRTSETRDGMNGYRFTGPNGNSIFMPFPGYAMSDPTNPANYQGNVFVYWTGDGYTAWSNYGYYFMESSQGFRHGAGEGNYYAIRPVY